jgi:hypothetical protein
MENTLIDRPVWNPAIKTRRAATWHWRYCSAWDLASIIDGDAVTETEYSAALALLDSIQRYAIADAREWEAENSSERYCNSAEHKARADQLDARRAQLQKRLARYGLRLVNYGLYPSIIDGAGNTLHFLHYFD